MTEAEQNLLEPSPQVRRPHRLWEDVHALVLGASFLAVGLAMLKATGIVVGGLAGMALILSDLTGANVGVLMAALNLPFYVFAQRALGWPFAVKTVVINLLLATLSLIMPQLMRFDDLNPLFAALFAGTLIGMGVLALTRHRASAGGIGVLIVFLNERYGIDTGKMQIMTDIVVLLAATVFVIDLEHLGLSIVCSAALSLVLFANHKPGRYTGY